MIGISLNGYGSINIGWLPDRQSAAFYVVRKGRIVATAYFRTEDDAREAARMLRTMAELPSFDTCLDHDVATQPEDRKRAHAETDRG